VFFSKSPLRVTKQVGAAVMFYRCIRQVLQSNLSHGTRYPDSCIPWFSSAPPCKFWGSISLSLPSILSIWIPLRVHQSFYYLPLCNLIHRQRHRRNHNHANRIIISYVIPVLSTGLCLLWQSVSVC
jgi:hypothetical protein